jgi:hypothetical protein
MDSRNEFRGCGVLELEVGSARIPNQGGNCRTTVNAEDEAAQVRMTLHQSPCFIRFSRTGQRMIHDILVLAFLGDFLEGWTTKSQDVARVGPDTPTRATVASGLRKSRQFHLALDGWDRP